MKNLVFYCIVYTILFGFSVNDVSGQIYDHPDNIDQIMGDLKGSHDDSVAIQKITNAPMPTKVPDQQNKLLNDLASKTWMVYRNPGNLIRKKRDSKHVDQVWRFTYGNDIRGNRRILLAVDDVSVRINGTWSRVDLTSSKKFEITYDRFNAFLAFSLNEYRIGKLKQDISIDWQSESHEFSKGSECIVIEGEDVATQRQANTIHFAREHYWKVQLYPLENDCWIGYLSDKFDREETIIPEQEELAKEQVDMFGMNRKHAIYLKPMKGQERKAFDEMPEVE